MAQIRDLLVAGKAKFLGTGVFSGLLDAAGGLKISGSAQITSNPTYVYAQNTETKEVGHINVQDLIVGKANALNIANTGSKITPIYLSNGVPVASDADIGSKSKPIYLSKGALTASDANIGGAATPVYMKAGVITAFASAIGGEKKPVYVNSSGAITASSTSVGNDAQPVYLNSGTFTAVNIISTTYGGTGNSAFTKGTLIYAETATKLSSNTYATTDAATITLKRTDTSSAKFTATNSNGSVQLLTSTNRGLYDATKSEWIVYTNTAGTATYVPLWKNIGSTKKQLVYFNSSGSAAASDATVGASSKPVYLNNGTITEIGVIETSKGGTGSSAQTRNRVVITDGSGNVNSSISSHYASGDKIFINSGDTEMPIGDEKLYVHGSAQVNGHLVLDTKVKFMYNNTDKCVDVIFM